MDLLEFKQTVLPYKNKLFRLAKFFLKNKEEAEDMTQEVYLKLWTEKHKLSEYRSIEALAVTVLKNKCLDKLKSKNYKTQINIEGKEFSSSGFNPYQALAEDDSKSFMLRLMELLPDQQKFLIRLRDIEEYTYEEMEEMTGLTVNNIRVILSRGRKSLRELYLKAQKHGS